MENFPPIATVMVIRMKILLIFCLLVLSQTVFAGDYCLTISDDMSASCVRRTNIMNYLCRLARKIGFECQLDLSYPVKTTDEVIESLEIYFSGEEPPITILLPAFSNGHLAFCTDIEKEKIYKALISIKDKGNYKHGRHIDDFINILGIKKINHNLSVNRKGTACGLAR